MDITYTEKGDIKAKNEPLVYSKDWFGAVLFYLLPSTLRHSTTNYRLDVASSETKTIKTIWSLDAKYDQKAEASDASRSVFSKSLIENLLGNKSLLKELSKEDRQWAAHKFQRVFKGLNEPFGYTVDVAAEFSGKKTRRLGTSITYGAGASGLSHRASVLMQHLAGESIVESIDDPSADNLVFCADFDGKFTGTVSTRRPQASEYASNIKIGFGKSCTDDRKIVISVRRFLFACRCPDGRFCCRGCGFSSVIGCLSEMKTINV